MRIFLCLLLGLTLHADAADQLKPYPVAEEGMTRHVINLPVLEKEQDSKVELIVGKTVETDPVNRYFFGGQLEEKTIEGWGYPYHMLPDLGPMGSTLIGVPPGTPNIKQFVAVRGEPTLIRYNSKLPVVVYVPKGCEVRYRIWTAPPEAKPVPEG